MTLCLLACLCAMPIAYAGDLHYRGQDLTQAGLYKGAGLPTGSGFFDAGILTTPIPAGIPANTLVFHFDLSFQSADALYGPSGNKVGGSHQTRTTLINPRFQYFYPWQPANPHLRFLTDLIVPIATAHAGDSTSAGVGDGGLADIVWAPLVAIWSSDGPWIKQSQDLSLFGSFPTGDYHSGGGRLFNLGKNKFKGFAVLQSRIVFKPLNNLEWHSEIDYSKSTTNDSYQVANSRDITRSLTGETTTSYHTGDFLDVSVDLAYPFIQTPKTALLVGPRFAGEWQLSDDELDGHRIDNSKQKTLTVGPTMTLQYGAFKLYGHYDFAISNRNSYAANVAKFGVIYAFSGKKITEMFN